MNLRSVLKATAFVAVVVLLLVALAELIAIANANDMETVGLNAEQSQALEISFLRLGNTTNQIKLLKLEIDRLERLRVDQEAAATAALKSVCAAHGIDPSTAQLTQDFKRLLGRKLDQKEDQ